jgi:transmembrane sensor
MKNEISHALLQKYLRGETTPEESAIVDEWYLSLQENPDDVSLLDPLESDFVQNKILDRIKSTIDVPQVTKPVVSPSKIFYIRTPFKLAAAITAIAVIGLGAILFHQKGLPSVQPLSFRQDVVVKKITNDTDKIRHVTLEDGTQIQLKPQSSIVYPEMFSKSERRVTMIGEAFFDVTKDKSRPFIIAAANVTIKVLGTSFNVSAYEGAKEISVAVRTGKVSVFSNIEGAQTPLETKQAVILTPNQEVVYNTTEDQFLKKLVAKPQIIAEKPALFETQYDGVPVVNILTALEQNYGIDILFDEPILSSCLLTTSLAEEGLYERIEIICKAIGAQYEIQDSQIVITSDGCL